MRATPYVRSARQNAPGTFKCPGRFTSLRSEQELYPLRRRGYPLKAKGVTPLSSRLLHILLSYEQRPKSWDVFYYCIV